MGSIIHELTLLQEKEGWLREDSLRELSRRLGVPLHRIESVSTFYTHFRRDEPKPVQVHSCRDLSCMLGGGESACAKIKAKLAGRDDVEFHEVSCIGRCEMAPAGFVNHDFMDFADTNAVVAAVEHAASGAKHAPQEVTTQSWDADVYATADEHYSTFRRAVAGELQADKIIADLEASGLRGMGGAGFPTGLKWKLVAAEKATPKYVICNADESEPGTFKDRAILSDLPHLVIEGMMLAAHTVQANHAWVFIRHEYEPERRAIERAIKDAYARGALGKNVFGSGFDLEMEIFVSPGGYILGEETALIECMEDKRGEPRNKPPFPGNQGLWNKPTLMNNVETFAHATGILNRGVDWWNALGAEGFAGHKFISVSGDVANPGVQLIPVGTTLRGLLERCGGMKDGKALAAVAPGGASSNFLPPDKLDTPMDFKPLADVGSMLGSGATVYVAEGHNLLEVGVNVARFFRNESCGKCVPCRVGSEKAVAMLEGKQALPAGCDTLLTELNETMVQTSICGLGQVALGPLMSIVENFPDSVPRE